MSPYKFNSGEIAKKINGECTNNNVSVSNFSSLPKANINSVSFYFDPKYKDELTHTNAGLVILKKKDAHLRSAASIYVDDPYLAFAKIANLFFSQKKNPFIHTDFVHGVNFKIGIDCSINAYVKIGNDSSIGANTTIDSFVCIGSNVKIGSNVNIGDDVIIGNNCNLFSGCAIGVDGFGYAREKDKSWIKIPQVGTVVIGDDVDIGSNTTIDRGALDNTIIEDGVKIDNQVQIAHNCIIGCNTIIAGCTGIAGSAVIGKNCMIGGGAMIKGHIKIADDTIISGGTGIGKTISEPGDRYTNVFPYNIKHKDWLKIAAKLKNWIKNDK